MKQIKLKLFIVISICSIFCSAPQIIQAEQKKEPPSNFEFTLEVLTGALGGAAGYALMSNSKYDPLSIGVPLGITLSTNLIAFLFGKETKLFESLLGAYWGGLITAGTTSLFIKSDGSSNQTESIYYIITILIPPVMATYPIHL